MKVNDLKDLLKDKRVVEEIGKHLWIESQKAGRSIGLERATEEWLKLYALGWMKFNLPQEYDRWMKKSPARSSKKTVSNNGFR